MKKYRQQTSLYLLIIYSAFMISAVAYFVLFLSKSTVFNSDTVDVMMWAKTTYESGHLINPDFSYAALLPFGASLLMLAFIPFFGISYTSMVLGMLLFVIILFLALIAFFRTIGFNSKWICISIIFLSSLMLSSLKFREMFLQHAIYYALSLLFILVGLTLSIKLIRFIEEQDKKKTITFSILLFFFVLLTASDGLTVISLSTVPIIIALLSQAFFNLKRPFIHEKNHPAFFSCLVLALGTIIGLIFTLFMLNGKTAGYANAYLSLASFAEASNWIENLQGFFVGWYTLFEVFFEESSNVFSLGNISALLRFAFASLILFMPFIALPFYNKIKDKNLKLSLFVQLSIIAIIAFMWFFGIVNAANWRLIPIAGFGIIFLTQITEYLFRDKIKLRRFSVLILIIVMLYSVIPVFELSEHKPDSNKSGKYQTLVNELEKRDVTYGYADFWDANALTILSSNQIIAKNYKYEEDESGDIILKNNPYQQDYSSIFKNCSDDEKYFIMIESFLCFQLEEYFSDNFIYVLDEFEIFNGDNTVYIIDMPLILSNK